jgi:diaminopimelate decarboxylase
MDGIRLGDLSEQYGTPLYVTSQQTLIHAAQSAQQALIGATSSLVCYAVKANPTLAILQTFAGQGLGADVTSGGELFRALKAGIPAEKIVFSGVGKSITELREAIAARILAIQIEVEEEIDILSKLADEMKVSIPVALRVNPQVDAQTHPSITTGMAENKFGLSKDHLPDLAIALQQNARLSLIGLSAHIGSQVTSLEPFHQCAVYMAGLARQLLDFGVPLEYVNYGGGLGVKYGDEQPPIFAEWGSVLRAAHGDLPVRLLVEPGRSLVADASVLLTRVTGIKRMGKKTFVIVDAGMNDLIRPALYGAYHPISHVLQREDTVEIAVEIVGPICETTDTFASERMLALPRAGDILAVGMVGAYGISMASNYNSRPRPAEILIEVGGEVKIIRTRETYADLIHHENLL